MSPLDFRSSEPLDQAATSNLSSGGGGGGGDSSIAREVQNQFSGLASAGKDAAMAALPGGAESGLGAIGAAGEQAVSPLINMITKMPGHIGLMSSFFEMLGAFFGPQLEALGQFGMSLGLDGSLLQDLGGDTISTLTSMTSEHLTLNLGLLPGNAPIFGHLGGSFNSDLLSSKLNASLGGSNQLFSQDAFSRSSLNVSGSGSMAKSAFEGAGHLSGPGMSNGIPDGQIAGNNRLFSDSIGGGQSLNSQTMAQSVPIQSQIQSSIQTPNASSLNVSGSTFGEPLNNDLLAMGNTNDSFQSTVGSMKHDLGTGQIKGGAENLGGLKAKSLSLDGHNGDLKADSLGDKHALPKHDVSHKVEAKTEMAKADHKVDAKHEAVRTHKTFDRVSHSVKPSHQNVQAAKPAPATTASHAAAKSAAPAQIETQQAEVAAQPEQPLSEQQQFEQQQMQQQQVAQNADVNQTQAQPEGGDAQTAPAEPRSYTIRSGDNLWNIAKDNLGNATKWSDIYKMNSDVLGANPDLIRPGTTIQLPGADAAASASTNVAHYTVQPGDNLWDIAHDQLGDATKWGDIYKANSEIIGSNPSMIHPGQELSLGGTADPSMQLSSAAQPDPTLASADPGAAAGTTNVNINPSGAEAQAQVAQSPTDSYGAEAGMPDQAMPGETLQAQQPQMQTPAAHNSGAATSSTSYSNYDAMRSNNQLPDPASLGEKVIPAKAQPDAIIQPAQAATQNMFASKPVVNTNLANDMLSFLKKRR